MFARVTEVENHDKRLILSYNKRRNLKMQIDFEKLNLDLHETFSQKIGSIYELTKLVYIALNEIFSMVIVEFLDKGIDGEMFFYTDCGEIKFELDKIGDSYIIRKAYSTENC